MAKASNSKKNAATDSTSNSGDNGQDAKHKTGSTVTDKPAAVPADTPFETALDELESLVGSLEAGEQSLEDSLAQFERGISLARHCQKSLTDAEQKISVLMNTGDSDLTDGNAELEAFSVDEIASDQS